MNTEQRVLEAVVRMEGMSGDISEIKGSMREMSAAINKLAIVEERQSQDRTALDRAFKGLVNVEARVRVLEEAQPLQKQSAEWVQKAIGLVITAVITAVLTLVIAHKAQAHVTLVPAISAHFTR